VQSRRRRWNTTPPRICNSGLEAAPACHPQDTRQRPTGLLLQRPTHSENSAAPPRTSPLATTSLRAAPTAKVGRAAILNALFDEWNSYRKGIAKAETPIARIGSVDWLFREYKQTRHISKRSLSARGPAMSTACRPSATCSTRKASASARCQSRASRRAPLINSMKSSSGMTRVRSILFRRGEKFIGLCRKALGAWFIGCTRQRFAKDVPNPWPGVTMKTRTKATKHAVTREQVYTFAQGCIERGEVGAAAAAVVCFEWLQRPENVLAGHIKWTGYRQSSPPTIQVEHHKTGARIDHHLKTSSTMARRCSSIRRQRRSWRT